MSKINCYINGMGFLAAQHINVKATLFFETTTSFTSKILHAQLPEVKDYLSRGEARRMSPAVKMGIIAAKKALADAKFRLPDAIITGTGMGCKQDSDNFLESLLTQDEGLVSPTKFIQSTHNTVGGQLALHLQTKVYNTTYVQGSNSFESALLDAYMLAHEQAFSHFLVGSVDEISNNTIGLHQLNETLKKEEPFKSIDLLQYHSDGSIAGEGAGFFCISAAKTEASYAKLTAIALYHAMTVDEVGVKLHQFLTKHELDETSIDAVVLGVNGDKHDQAYYAEVQQIFETVPQLAYKHLVGEFYTASAIGFGFAAHVLNRQDFPEVCLLNKVLPGTDLRRILVYNQYLGRNHSFILLEQC